MKRERSIKLIFGIPTKLLLVAGVVFPLILYPVLKIGRKLRKISSASQEKIADINNMLLETITGIKLVKAFNMEDYERKRFFDDHLGKTIEVFDYGIFVFRALSADDLMKLLLLRSHRHE